MDRRNWTYPEIEQPKEDDLRVWWIPQIPGKPFLVPVKDVEYAKFLLVALAKYDLFQLYFDIKPDYSNAGGLEVFSGGEWSDWWDKDGNDINEVMRAEATKAKEGPRPNS
jgi:hypothetical protein